MLLAGLKFLEDKPNFDWSGYRQYRGITGIAMAQNHDAEALDKVLLEAVGGDATGAMHQGVINDLAYIHKHGYDAWLAEGEKHGRNIYETTEEELDHTILMSKIEWQLKLDGGYNPMAELFKSVPLEDVISIDPSNPESIRKAAEEIARRIQRSEGER